LIILTNLGELLIDLLKSFLDTLKFVFHCPSHTINSHQVLWESRADYTMSDNGILGAAARIFTYSGTFGGDHTSSW
jgi:hypothetical protein